MHNVEKNQCHVTPGCEVRCIGYEWGKDVKPLLYVESPRISSPVDCRIHIVLMSDPVKSSRGVNMDLPGPMELP